MGLPAAKKGDKVVAVDLHIVLAPSPSGTTPMTLPHPFSGMLDEGLSGDVNIMGQPAATVDSVANNSPKHIPTAPGASFQNPPSNRATVAQGSSTVKINGKAAARATDPATTCRDTEGTPRGMIVAQGTVNVG